MTEVANGFVFNIVEQFLKQRKRLAFVFLLGVFLGIGAQTNALTQLIHAGKVVFPQIIQHLQHHLALDFTHLLTHMGVSVIVGLLQALGNFCAQGLFIETAILVQPALYWQWGSKFRLQSLFQTFHVPLLFKTLRWQIITDALVRHIFADIGDHL